MLSLYNKSLQTYWLKTENSVVYCFEDQKLQKAWDGWFSHFKRSCLRSMVISWRIGRSGGLNDFFFFHVWCLGRDGYMARFSGDAWLKSLHVGYLTWQSHSSPRSYMWLSQLKIIGPREQKLQSMLWSNSKGIALYSATLLVKQFPIFSQI